MTDKPVPGTSWSAAGSGLVRPTWHGERSRPGWQPVSTAGTVLLVKGTGRVTPAGNGRVRDAAAVSLLHALQQEQKNAANAALCTGSAT